MATTNCPATDMKCNLCHNKREVLRGLNVVPCPACRYPGWNYPAWLQPTGHSLVHPSAKDVDGGPQLTKEHEIKIHP